MQANACSIVAGRPIASIAHGTPPGAMSSTRSSTSPSRASIVCVAPRCRASSNLAGSTSTTMIGSAPTSRAPMMLESPTPPAPKTSNGLPAASSTTLSTAPRPVMTAQPAIAAISGGTPSGTRTTDFSETTTRSAKQDTPRKWCSFSVPSCSREVPSGSPPVVAWILPSRHITGLPLTQASHSPQRGRHRSATRSPTATVPPARGPSCSTMPAPSCPSTTGSGQVICPVM